MHHKVVTTIRKVAAGEKITRNLGGSAYAQGYVPTDGFSIKTESGGVSHLCFITVEDFEAAKELKSGEEVTAKAWDSDPTKEAIEAASPPKIPKK